MDRSEQNRSEQNLSEQIEDLADQHLADTDAPPEELLRRLGAKLDRQRRAVRHLQTKIANVSDTLQSTASARVAALSGAEGGKPA